MLNTINQTFKRTYAGHNKWSKIKRDKGANDSIRAALFSKISSQIISAINAGNGETDPSLNLYLSSALNKAKQSQMPKSSIESALQRAKLKSPLDTHQIFYEGFGPGGIAFIAEALTTNRNKTFNLVRHLFMENGSLASVSFLFRRSAFFTLTLNDVEKDSNDIILCDYALNIKGISEKEIEVETCITDSFNFQEFSRKMGITVEFADIRHEPNNRLSISEADKNQVESFLKELKEIQDVVGVAHNAQL
jgi:YebC/PmpR family DNA-binding regulatory protein